MHHIFARIKPHRTALLLAFVLGVLTMSGPLLATWRIPAFSGIYPMVSDDESYYLGRIREAAEGRCTAVSPYIREYQTERPVTPWLAECVLGTIARASGISVVTLSLVLDFVLPALAAMLIYLLIWQLTESRVAGIASMLTLQGILFFEVMNRPVSPQFNVIFLLGGMMALLWWLRERSWRAVLVCMLLLSAQMYTYFYFWTFTVVWCGVLGVWFAARRDWRAVWHIATIVVGAALLSAPYFFDTWRATQLPIYTETLLRWGAIETLVPSGWRIMVATLVGIGALALSHLNRFKKISFEKKSGVAFLATGLIAIVVASNHHLLTNNNVIFASHYLMPAVYLLVGALVVSFVRVGLFSHRALRIGIIAVVTASAVWTIGGVIKKQSTPGPFDSLSQRYAPLFVWLNKYAPPNATLFTNDLLTYLTPVYTHNTVVHGFMAGMSPASTNDLQQRFLVAHYYEPLTDEFIRTHQYWLHGAVCLVRPRAADCVDGSRLFEPTRAQFAVVRNRPLDEWLRQYGAQFIVIDRAIDPAWKIELTARLPKLYSEQGVEVYRTQ